MTMNEEQEIAGVTVEELKDELLFHIRNLEDTGGLSLKEARLDMERRFGTSFAKKKEDKTAFKRVVEEALEIVEQEEEEEEEEEENNNINNNIKNTTTKTTSSSQSHTTKHTTFSSSSSSSTENDIDSISKPQKSAPKLSSIPSSDQSAYDKLMSELLERKRSRDERLAKSLGFTDDTEVSKQSTLQDKMFAPRSSVWKQVEVTQSMFLLPADFEDVENSIVSFLNGRLMKFRHEIGGVLCAYSDLRIVGHKVPISYSGKPMTPPFLFAPFVQFRIRYKALLFVPITQVTLWGEIKTVSSEHIGMVCYGLFNSSIRSHNTGHEFTYSHKHKAWMHKSTGNLLNIGTKVPFQVNSYDTKGLLHIFGTLQEGDWIYSVKNDNTPIKEEQSNLSTATNQDHSTETTTMDIDENEQIKSEPIKKEKQEETETKKTSKKNKKRKAREMINGDHEQIEEPAKKKKKISKDSKSKKKKKSKDKKTNDENKETEEPSSNKTKKKTKKKKKAKKKKNKSE